MRTPASLPALLIGLTLAATAQAEDPQEVRPTLVVPQLSIPHQLITVPVAAPHDIFVPPNVVDIPNDKYGELVRLGRNIFVHTQGYAKRYVGNGLNCVSCHLSEGRKPDAAPLWGAYGMYPAYRAKTDRVSTYQERLQDCFRFSMNGIAPPIGSQEIQSLVAYSHWLSTGAPTNVEMTGRGFPSVPRKQDPSPSRGRDVYQTQCQVCHGKNGEGVKVAGQYQFPPLWGADSYNKGAGMHQVDTAARFIKANMPLGKGYSLSDQDAWDVAAYINQQWRPSDPRKGAISGLMEK